MVPLTVLVSSAAISFIEMESEERQTKQFWINYIKNPGKIGC
jgi:hypothetical protein